MSGEEKEAWGAQSMRTGSWNPSMGQVSKKVISSLLGLMLVYPVKSPGEIFKVLTPGPHTQR
jgi:hypothetical protein